MRRIVGPAIALLGAFLLVVGVLAQTYATDALKRTPIDTDSTTSLAGTAQLSDGTQLNQLDVLAWSVTKTDTDKSDDDVVSYANSSCLVKDEGGIDTCVSSDDPEDRLLSASTDNFATDRITAEAVNDPKYLPADAAPHEGLINKWPFEPEEKTYPYFDGLVGGAVDAVYQGREELEGQETMVYKVTVEGQPIEVAEGVPGTYNDEKLIYIHPYTGAIIHQVDKQERLDAEGNPVLLAELAFTDEQIKTNVDDNKANTTKLKLVTETVPLIGYALGIPLILLGLGLMVLRLRRRNDTAESAGASSGT